jgi:subtilisin-like proprotein convertase family protein
MTSRRRILAGMALGFVLAAVIASTAPASGPYGAWLVHRSVSVQSTADGDPIVENTEQFTFVVEIRNIGDAPATGITGTLAPNQWTAQQGTSAFPDIPPGGSATNTTPFAATAPSFSCGGQLNAVLNVATQQGGSFAVPVTIPLTGIVAPASWTSTTPVAIPDPGTVEAPLVVSGAEAGSIMDVNVRIGELRHEWDADLLISLRPPGWSGSVGLSVFQGFGPDFLNTVFDDESEVAMYQGAPPFTGTFRPDSGITLASVDGHQAAGTWNLRIQDYEELASGTLHSWGIDLLTVRCNPPPYAAFTTIPDAPNAGQTVTFRSTSSDGGHIVSQAWDLDNDGAYDDASGATATRSFPTADTYKVGLRVTDDGENATSVTYNVFVAAAPRITRSVCRVPRVVGRKLRVARTAIRRAGCRVGRVRYARSRKARGRVLRQTPRAGASRARGTRVNLTVSRGRG